MSATCEHGNFIDYANGSDITETTCMCCGALIAHGQKLCLECD